MKSPILKYSVTASLALLASCGSMSDDSNASKTDDPNLIVVPTAACADVNDPAVDQQVATANQAMQSSVQDMVDAMADGNWSAAQNSAPNQSTATYNAVLAQYPGHCGAQFGKSMATLANLVHNQDLMDAIDSLKNGNGLVPSYTEAVDASTEQQAGMLLKIAQGTSNSDPITVTRIQNILAKVIPATDTAISMLTNIMNEKDFSVNFQFERPDGSLKTIQIDKGEVGPALAMIKYMKAILVSLIAVQAEVSIDGSYAWADTLKNIKNGSFDNLSPAQKSALDHVVGLTSKTSPFLTIKDEWKEEYAKIPALLESGISDLQAGLNYGVAEAKKGQVGQEYDVYVVGDWADADVSPKSLQDASTNLERIKKYLSGNVTMTWAAGSHSLVVNIPKFFQIHNGYQDYLPYHTVLPYTQWNDTIATDTTWYNSFYTYSLAFDELVKSVSLAAFGKNVESSNWDYLYYSSAPNADQINATLGAINEYSTIAIDYDNGVTAYLVDPTTCTATFLLSTESATRTVSLNACKLDPVASEVNFAYDASVVIRGPFIFTDAKGNASFGENMEEDMDKLYKEKGLLGFSNKIIFPDPTFGGIFPKLTQTSIWTTLEALKEIKPRTACAPPPADMTQAELAEGEYYGYGDCWYSEQVMPEKPSDLDVLNYYFD